MSAPIHATVSGTVAGVTDDSVHIKSDGNNRLYDGIKWPVINNREDFLRTVRHSGIVGMGGAGLPTHVKLKLEDKDKVDTLVVNGAECEPYITSDYRELMENYDHLLKGAGLVMSHLGIEKCIIGIEDNKPKAISLLRQEINDRAMQKTVSVIELPARYPYGAEKILIKATTGRTVPLNGLPKDVGVIVLNVTTLSMMNQYLETGIPVIKKRITVAGEAIANPGNVFVTIGTAISDIINFCGGYKQEPAKIIIGGPMMGILQNDISSPITKQHNALLCLSDKETFFPKQTPCIRCGACVNTCPMNLSPIYIERYANSGKKNLKMLGKLNVSACVECGCCAYGCPAKLPLLDNIRLCKEINKKGGV